MNTKINSPGPLIILVLALLSACASTNSDELEGEPYSPPGEEQADSIGFYLAQISKAINGWNRTKLEARNEEDKRRVRTFERTIQRMARLRVGDLLIELESGPPANRRISAVALGFTGMEEALSPLLSALEDPDPLVVSEALLGLGLLQLPETPLAQICHLLRRDPDNYTRNNAAYAMQRILLSGGADPCTVQSARDALLDSESAVRAKAALILYLVRDTDSITALGDLLYDEEGVVAAAASTSLARLGADKIYTGSVARLMVAALDRVHPTHRNFVLNELRRLHKKDLGEESEPWRDWAYRLP
ncbi:MAG: HEAT repeat protein [Planctomycetota bacterium]|jgi:HEAT repeat protein